MTRHTFENKIIHSNKKRYCIICRSYFEGPTGRCKLSSRFATSCTWAFLMLGHSLDFTFIVPKVLNSVQLTCKVQQQIHVRPRYLLPKISIVLWQLLLLLSVVRPRYHCNAAPSAAKTFLRRKAMHTRQRIVKKERKKNHKVKSDFN